MTRKLATIRRIDDLLPIKGADRIEVAIIGGWQVVTQKGQHTKGDLVVFYEIDSWLPADDPRYASFEERFTNWGDKRGMRLKTIKLRKTLSQGLIMPVREFPEILDRFGAVEEGQDVTEALKIEKWEPIEKASSNQPGQQGTKSFPAFIRKTDQERIQNYGHVVAKALDDTFEVTVKKDGSSCTVFRVDPSSAYYEAAVALTRGKLGFWAKVKAYVRDRVKGRYAVYGICSRNVLLPLVGTSNFHIAAEAPLRALLADTDNASLAIQGELVAPDVQGNYEKVSEVEFHMFDLFDIDKQAYVLPVERRSWAAQNGINHATIVDQGTLRNILRLKDGDDVIKVALTYASGQGDNAGVDREGVVMKCDTKDLSFKIVSNEYLLATGK